MNLYLYYAIGFSGIGALMMVRYYNDSSMLSLIIGVACLILGSMNGKKWQENRDKEQN